jgi:hypothetical protein
MFRPFTRLMLAAAASLLVAPAAAQAQPVAGAVTNDAGGTDSAQQDILNAAVVYDPAGTLRGALVVGEAPTYTGVAGLEIGVGTWSKRRGWCQNEADVDMYPPEPEIPEWWGGLSVGGQDGPDPLFSAQGTTVTFDATTPEVAGKRWNCARAETYGPADDPKTNDYKVNDVTEVFSLTAQEAQRPEAPPECALAKHRVRRGRKVALRCSNVSGRVTIRIYKTNRLKRTVKASVGAGGRVTVSTRGLRRGWWGVLAWRGSEVFGHGDFRVR